MCFRLMKAKNGIQFVTNIVKKTNRCESMRQMCQTKRRDKREEKTDGWTDLEARKEVRSRDRCYAFYKN